MLPCCGNCKFWLKQECRRHAPEVLGSAIAQTTRWPLTCAGSWCGDFQERPVDAVDTVKTRLFLAHNLERLNDIQIEAADKLLTNAKTVSVQFFADATNPIIRDQR